jgi:hypothetical protein
LSELRAALGGLDGSSLEIHLQAEIECTEMHLEEPRSSKLRDALGGRDQSSLEMQLETEIE